MPAPQIEILNAALEKVQVPEILINMVSQRVRQFSLGHRPLVPVDPRWSLMDVALKEIAEGKLTYELLPQEELSPKPQQKRSSRTSRTLREATSRA